MDFEQNLMHIHSKKNIPIAEIGKIIGSIWMTLRKLVNGQWVKDGINL